MISSVYCAFCSCHAPCIKGWLRRLQRHIENWVTHSRLHPTAMHYINEPDNAVKAREILKLVYLFLSQLLLRLSGSEPRSARSATRYSRWLDRSVDKL